MNEYDWITHTAEVVKARIGYRVVSKTFMRTREGYTMQDPWPAAPVWRLTRAAADRLAVRVRAGRG